MEDAFSVFCDFYRCLFSKRKLSLVHSEGTVQVKANVWMRLYRGDELTWDRAVPLRREAAQSHHSSSSGDDVLQR